MSTDVGIAVGELRESVSELKSLERRFEKLESAFHNGRPMSTTAKWAVGILSTLALSFAGWVTDHILRDERHMETLAPLVEIVRDHQTKLTVIDSNMFPAKDGARIWEEMAKLAGQDAVAATQIAAVQESLRRIESKLDRIDQALRR